MPTLFDLCLAHIALQIQKQQETKVLRVKPRDVDEYEAITQEVRVWYSSPPVTIKSPGRCLSVLHMLVSALCGLMPTHAFACACTLLCTVLSPT